MNDTFEKFNQLNLMVSAEDVFDYIGASLEKDDGFRLTYSCPYHADDLPSLLVEKNSGKYNCFACECGGIGGYSCAKYYLQQTNNTKPTTMMVVNFLIEINPNVEQYKYLFSVKARPKYDYSQNKRRDFNNRVRIPDPATTLAVHKRGLDDKNVAIYIDAIMTDMPEEFVVHTLGVRDKKNQPEGSEEFLSLLGE